VLEVMLLFVEVEKEVVELVDTEHLFLAELKFH
jgi:hypothetical protein